MFVFALVFSVIADINLLKLKKNPNQKRHNTQHEEHWTHSHVLAIKVAEGPLLTSPNTESVDNEH